MDTLTRKDVDAIALLARLELSDEEAERLCRELTAILEHMDRLAAVDTDGVEPMTHAVPMMLRLRADEIEPSLPVEQALAGAPDREDAGFRVPAILTAQRGDAE